MITKSKIWYLTLSSVILALSVYYVMSPIDDTSSVFSENLNNEFVSIEDSEILTALEVNKDENREKSYEELQSLILDDNSSINEKNEAYEQIQYMNANVSLEDSIQKEIKKKFKYNTFIEIDNGNLKVVLDNVDKSNKIANDIINYINDKTDNIYFATVKFE